MIRILNILEDSITGNMETSRQLQKLTQVKLWLNVIEKITRDSKRFQY
jgi:hypothetical protein